MNVKYFTQHPDLDPCWTITRVKVSDVLQFHLRLHPGTTPQQWRKVSFSDDGIPESNSSNISLDIISLNFTGCRNVYCLAIARPVKPYKVDPEEIYERLVKELNDADLEVSHADADALKRCILRQILQHNGKQGKSGGICVQLLTTFVDKLL